VRLIKIKRAFRQQSSADRWVIHCAEPAMDLVMLAIGAAFFALSIGYVAACDRL
jgi:hypothetical protein